jgi:hypothetical protein
MEEVDRPLLPPKKLFSPTSSPKSVKGLEWPWGLPSPPSSPWPKQRTMPPLVNFLQHVTGTEDLRMGNRGFPRARGMRGGSALSSANNSIYIFWASGLGYPLLWGLHGEQLGELLIKGPPSPQGSCRKPRSMRKARTGPKGV